MTPQQKALQDCIEAQQKLIRAYVSLLESGHDRIIYLGGKCDPVDQMEASDPALREAKAAITKAKQALDHVPDAGKEAAARKEPANHLPTAPEYTKS